MHDCATRAGLRRRVRGRVERRRTAERGDRHPADELAAVRSDGLRFTRPTFFDWESWRTPRCAGVSPFGGSSLYASAGCFGVRLPRGRWVCARFECADAGGRGCKVKSPVFQRAVAQGFRGWRREWDSNPGAPFRFCKLQNPHCRECQECRRCRGPLHAVARQQSLAPIDRSTCRHMAYTHVYGAG